MMISYKIVIATLAFCAVAAAGTQKATPIEAIAFLDGPVINGKQVRGVVTFTQNACGENVHIQVNISGLEPGKHGFHIHEKGDISGGCMSTGGHYNPDKLEHGAREDEIRHVGDLGNVEANELGVAYTFITDGNISLTNSHSIVGRSVVVHEKVDDLGKGNHPDSKKTGNAGGRLACGVIGLNQASYEPSIPTQKPTFYVHHHQQQPNAHVVYPILSTGYPYPYYYQ